VAHKTASRVLKCKLLWQTVEFLTFRVNVNVNVNTNVNVNVKVNFTLEQGMKVYRGSRGIALLFH